MTQDQWRRVTEIVGDALELQPHERTTFLDAACNCDADLRRHVEALLASDRDGHEFMVVPANLLLLPVGDSGESLTGGVCTAPFPETMIGVRVGAYEILEQIGIG